MSDDPGRPANTDLRTPTWFAVAITVGVALVTVLFDLLRIGNLVQVVLMCVGVGFLLLGLYMGLVRHQRSGAVAGGVCGLGFLIGPFVGHFISNLFMS